MCNALTNICIPRSLFTISNRLAKMQLMKTLSFLAFAAYVHAQCATCPSTMGNQQFVSSCVSAGLTRCNYNGGQDCVYTSGGQNVLLLSSGDFCASAVGTTNNCVSC
ncbi:hypothetical protein EDC04DRAFT_2675386 [Pisolithus marmoratus]|nr:hypothetical protein EDC04DRAFT_2675386 [Pisolithus marmoratus]